MTHTNVISMTRNIASEFGPLNIRANTISPGTIATEMVNQVDFAVKKKGVGKVQDLLNLGDTWTVK